MRYFRAGVAMLLCLACAVGLVLLSSYPAFPGVWKGPTWLRYVTMLCQAIGIIGWGATAREQWKGRMP